MALSGVRPVGIPEQRFRRSSKYVAATTEGEILARLSARSMLTKDWKQIFWVMEGFKLYCYRSRDDYYYNPKGQKNLCVSMACCYDGISAKMIEQSGNFNVTFMSGFSVAASHGVPDTQLIGLEEMATAARICNSVLKKTPLIGDADTGYGNCVNIKVRHRKLTWS